MKAYIRLEYGSAILTAAQRLRYKCGDILQGTYVDTMHETLAEWDITEVETAITRLARFKCEDKQLEPDVYRVEEYGLVFVVPDKMVWYTIAAPEAVVAAT